MSDRPLRCLAFSANWYQSHILCYLFEGIFAYGSNNDIFIIDYEKKVFLS